MKSLILDARKIKYTQTNNDKISLLGVIAEHTLVFLHDNFIKDGKFYIPKIANPFFIYRAIRFILKLAKMMKMYKTDYIGFVNKYAQDQLYEPQEKEIIF